MSINTTVFTALNGAVSGRMYPLTLPAGVTFPAITYFQVSKVAGYTHNKADGTTRERWQFSCWARSYKAAKELAATITGTLNTYTGGTGAVVKMSMKENETDIADPEPGLFQVPVDFIFLVQST